MPGARALLDHLRDLSRLVDQIVARDLGGGIAQPIDGGLGTFHAGIVKDEEMRLEAVAPRLGIGRRAPAMGKEGAHHRLRARAICA